MDFIYAEELKKIFTVTGHFYELKVNGEPFQCRSCLEIFLKSKLSKNLSDPNAIVIMMNPGSSIPLDKEYKPKTFNPEQIYSKSWKKEFVPTRPDNAQYQIMRLMLLKNWEYVRVLNLSDLRNGNSSDFINEFKRARKFDPTDPHSITNANRSYELRDSCKPNNGGVIIVGWGKVKILRDAAEYVLSKFPNMVGLSAGGPWFRYPSPYMKVQKLDWLNQMVEIV
jgi:hypothetical protein